MTATPTMNPKPIMMLDASLPRTYDYPHKAGKQWHEKMNELRGLQFELMDADHGKDRDDVMARIHDAREDVTFKPVPYFAQNHLMMGAEAAKRAQGMADPIPNMAGSGWISCHPDTWAAIPEKTKAAFYLHAPPAMP